MPDSEDQHSMMLDQDKPLAAVQDPDELWELCMREYADRVGSNFSRWRWPIRRTT